MPFPAVLAQQSDSLHAWFTQGMPLVWIAVAVAVGVFIQSAVGFGGGLFGIPIMLWAKVTLPVAITVILTVVVFQSAWACYQYRKHVPWPDVGRLFFPWRLAGLFLGVWLLSLLAGLNQAQVKQVVGLFILLAVLMQWFGKIKPREHIGYGWTVLAGSSSGVLAGSVGMGGPPLVLWVMAHDWPAKRSRSFLWASFGVAIPVQLTIMFWKFGEPVGQGIMLGITAVPVLLAATFTGTWVGAKLSKQRLRGVAFGLLILLAVASVLSPLIT